MKLQNIFEKDNIKIEEYTPTVFQPLYKKIDNMYFNKWIRFIIVSLSGGKIYYLSEDSNVVGYCMIVKGKSYRYLFAKKNDIIVGPIYLSQKYRGKGYARLLLEQSLKYYNKKYGFGNAFAYIWRTNIASNKIFLRIGFKIIAQIEVKKYSRKVVISNKSKMDYQLFQLDSKQLTND